MVFHQGILTLTALYWAADKISSSARKDCEERVWSFFREPALATAGSLSGDGGSRVVGDPHTPGKMNEPSYSTIEAWDEKTFRTTGAWRAVRHLKGHAPEPCAHKHASKKDAKSCRKFPSDKLLTP
jgi:hypothetical protein